MLDTFAAKHNFSFSLGKRFSLFKSEVDAQSHFLSEFAGKSDYKIK